MSKYIFVVKTQIIKSLTYRFNVYGNIIMQTIIMITASFFWKALYKTSLEISGTDVESMLIYTVLSSMLSVVLFTNVERRIEDSVKKGTVAADLMKPINIFGVYFAEDVGSIVALIFQNLIPIFVIATIVIKLPVISDVSYIPIFIVSVIMSIFINWFIAALFGMWSFTALDIDALIQVKKHLVRLLSGSIIPLWFFPDWLRNILEALPFAYIYQLPLSIYIGKGSLASFIEQMKIQFVWLLILAAAFYLLQKSIVKKVMVQGG